MKTLKLRLLNLVGKVGQTKIKGLSRGVVILFALLILLINILYLSGWGSLWYATRRPDLPSLLALLRENYSVPAVAAVSALAALIVDRDGDGVPDKVQKEGKEYESNTDIH